jgi:hypothetical protein
MFCNCIAFKCAVQVLAVPKFVIHKMTFSMVYYEPKHCLSCCGPHGPYKAASARVTYAVSRPNKITYYRTTYISSKWSQMKISKMETRCLIDRLSARSWNTFKITSHLKSLILFQRYKQMLRLTTFCWQIPSFQLFLQLFRSFPCYLSPLAKELSDIWEGSSQSANDATRRPLRKQKIHCRLHKSL